GFCTPGMIMTTACLLSANPKPSDEDIVHALEGNLCRCTGYVNIIESVREASRLIAAHQA
ncbi:MAG: (2Fe-2S)-binding protein, partial [Betaproteobacteria bacterium]|nr:(2Fe-2S)-binding protein [Betaproteobacteria bacterium]NCZ74914.1 (2Fe-2S)-binding protein [Betaproteobacteria bacterium]